MTIPRRRAPPPGEAPEADRDIAAGRTTFHETTDESATFTFEGERRPGKRHVIWRRVGGHEIYDNP